MFFVFQCELYTLIIRSSNTCGSDIKLIMRKYEILYCNPIIFNACFWYFWCKTYPDCKLKLFFTSNGMLLGMTEILGIKTSSPTTQLVSCDISWVVLLHECGAFRFLRKIIGVSFFSMTLSVGTSGSSKWLRNEWE